MLDKFINALLREIRSDRELHTAALAGGKPSGWEEYKFIVAKITVLNMVEGWVKREMEKMKLEEEH